MLDVRFLHHLEELARVGAEAFDVAALAFGVDGVEGEARLARSAKAGDDRQALARDVHVDPLEVVLARATDAYVSQHTAGLSFGMCVSIRQAYASECESASKSVRSVYVLISRRPHGRSTRLSPY